jgi:GH24 family phage-related lysozyme (muramidase)
LLQHQLDALTSWTYNLGVGNLSSSTLLKKLNTGDYESVPSEMVRWNKAGGKVLAGLTRRREAEAELWAKAVG